LGPDPPRISVTVSQTDLAPPLPAKLAGLRDGKLPVWVFAYGSLLWDDELNFAAAEPALLRGYHRSFCIWSYDYRGTPARPGLVLGLNHGGSCRGMALRVPAESVAETIDGVWLREMGGRPVYKMKLLPVRTTYGSVNAIAFTALRNCTDYAGRLPLDEMARVILDAVGRRGSCRDYFATTLRHLEQLGFVDPSLRRLAERVEALATQGRHGGV
jgi:cation transport protein ChaC